MRIILFFDLPVKTAAQRRDYTHFRKFLLKSGFVMLQESVYCKLTLNQTATSLMLNALRNNRPKSGLVQVLTITEKQFAKMEFLVGSCKDDVVNSEERFVKL